MESPRLADESAPQDPGAALAVPSGMGAEVDRHIAALVASAPPPTQAQIDRIRGLLTPAIEEQAMESDEAARQRPA